MPNKKINALDVRTAVSTDLMLVGDPTTGTAYKSTLATLPLVPYTGATGAVNLGGYDLTVNELTIGKGLASLSNNSALGKRALFHTTTGNYNTAVGHEAGHNLTTGQYNTAIGQSSMFTATNAAQNVAIGVNALLLTTSGGSNVVVGLDGMQHNTTGSSNTAIGYNAGSHITGGITPNTTASNSVYIGRDSKPLADNQSNQIVIGYNAVGNGSNTATIGNSSTTANYFTGSINGGSFVKSGGTSSQFLKADGSVDSSTYTPTSRTLTINGTAFDLSADRSWTVSAAAAGSTTQIQYNNAGAFAGSANLVWDNTNSRLGINGNININATASAWSGGFKVIEMQGGATIASFTSIPSAQILTNLYNTGTGLNRITATFGTRYYQLSGQHVFEVTGSGAAGSTATMTTAMTLTNAGRLLLGTTTESTFILDVVGDAIIRGNLAIRTANSTGAYGLDVINSGGSDLLRVSNNGAFIYMSLGRTQILHKTINSVAGASIGLSGGLQWGTINGNNVNIWANRSAGPERNILAANADSGVKIALPNDGVFLPSSIFEVASTTKGFLPPRMTTTQINAIATPAEGLQVYNTTINHMCFYMNGAWARISHSPM